MPNINSVNDCSVIQLPKLGDERGYITPINNNIEVPFEIKRVFYIYDIPTGVSRGDHAHKTCHELLIAVSGGLRVVLDDGTNKREIRLNTPNCGLHILPGIWAKEKNFYPGTICLALSSHLYDENDYIKNYDNYLNWRQTQ